MRLTQRCIECVNSVLDDTNLQNDSGFSLYTVLFVCHMITTLDEWMKFKMEVSANWCIAIEY